MRSANPTLNVPQAQFLAMPHKFRAFVAGFGCLRGDALVVTEFGPMPIQDIDRPMRVLSWSETNSRFELALSGGAFPKGTGNLYRVETQRGVFVASGHHRVLCADGSYQPVAALVAGETVLASSQSLPLTNWGAVPKSSHAGGRGSIQTLADSMGRYADEARQYGQRLLTQVGAAPAFSPSRAGAQASGQNSVLPDGLLARSQASSRQGQPSGLRGIHDLGRQPERLAAAEVRCGCGACFGRAFQSTQPAPQSAPKSSRHPQVQGSLQAGRFDAPASRAASASGRSAGCTDTHGFVRSQQGGQPQKLTDLAMPGRTQESQEASFTCSGIESSHIISIEALPEQEAYFDLQVLDNNCYVTVDGAIHHNSGKTWVGCSAQTQHFWEHPRVNLGYFAPTYAQIRDIYYPTIEEVAHDWGLKTLVNQGNHEVHIYSGRKYRGTVICRSMEKPETIIGFKIGRAMVDELDVMKITKAQHAWRKILARLRLKFDGLNGADVTTTPEGFKFVYQQWVKAVRANPKLAAMYGMVQASTYDNEANLPDDYIESLLQSYPEQLIKAYLGGQFVNLTSGTVYHTYDRQLNASQESVQPGEPLFIGMDFNVGKMAAVTHVKRLGMPHAVDEVANGYDTPDMIKRLKERYWLYADGEYRATREIRIYPDASGDGRRSVNASTTDIALLKQAGFSVIAPAANPPVKDRINAMNAMFCNAQGERRYRVNSDLCPTYADCLEQQVWADNGEPDKTQGNDHHPDAGGYYIHKEFPIIKPVTSIKMGYAY